MRLEFTERGRDQYRVWEQNDPKLFDKINKLLNDCRRSPFSGLGKPEPLRGDLSGWWSRRIDGVHRLVYRIEGDRLIVAQCRYHYRK
jgi:toxin YoeB